MKVVFLSKNFRDGEATTEYVKELAEKAVERGYDAAVISFDDGSYYDIDDRVEVHRVDIHFEGDNIYNWSMMMNNEIKRKAREIFEDPDVIHAVDWTSFPGAVTLSKHFDVPLILTFQSTENERGFEGDHAGLISELEWQGAFEADRVIATDDDTKNSLLFDLDVPGEKLEVIDPFREDWAGDILKIYQDVLKQEKEVLNKG